MRKIISLGLLVLTFLTFSAPAFAGFDQCEEDKDLLRSLGLYGLCNAYWDNDGDVEKQLSILAKFMDRAPAGVDMPGLDTTSDPDFVCPCWSEVYFSNICELGAPSVAILNGPIGIVTFRNDAIGLDEFFSTDSENCNYRGQFNIGDETLLNLGDFGLDCRAEIETIATLFISNGCEAF